MAVFQKILGMEHDIQRPAKATFIAAKRKWDKQQHKQEDIKTDRGSALITLLVAFARLRNCQNLFDGIGNSYA